MSSTTSPTQCANWPLFRLSDRISPHPEQEELPLLMSVTTLADALGVSPSTVRSIRASGHGPRPTKVGGRLFFRDN